jgi:hypothetical protein
VALELRADQHPVLVRADFLPQRPRPVGRVAGQVANNEELALGKDFDQGSAVKLADGNELAARFRISPAPGRRASLSGTVVTGTAELGVVDEVVQVDVVTLERLERVALDGLGLSVDALGVVQTGPLG